jgi:hypothetical protein
MLDRHVAIKLDEHQLTKLDRLVAATGRTRSGIFRRMLDQVEIVPDLRLPAAPLGLGDANGE